MLQIGKRFPNGLSAIHDVTISGDDYMNYLTSKTINQNGSYVAINDGAYAYNIVNVIGQDDKLKEFIEGTLETYESSNVITIPSYAFAGCTYLSMASFPRCGYICTNAFKDCHSLKDIYLVYYGFCSLESIDSLPSVFRNSVSDTNRHIYVHPHLLSSYITDSIWSNYSDKILAFGSAMG